MFSEDFKQRIAYQEYINNEALLKALEEPSPVSIRINNEKWDRKPVNAELVPWCETGFYLESRPSFSLDPLYHSGCYYPQEASGMLENTVLCSQRQKRILRDVWPALKENGILIYSTCTFNPSENEQVVEWLTNNEEAENVRLDISEFREITKVEYRNITGYGFYPDKIKGEGFFVSVIRKTGKSGKTQIRNRKKTGDRPGKLDLPVLRDWTTLPDQNLLRNGNEIISVAGRVDDYLFLAANLNIIKGGIRICTVKKKNYLPSHELALSKEFRKGSFPHSELDYHQAVDYLRRESIVLSGLPKGWFIVTYKGVNLGFANNLGSRINNYYPVNWRIRMRIPELRKDDLIKWE